MVTLATHGETGAYCRFSSTLGETGHTGDTAAHLVTQDRLDRKGNLLTRGTPGEKGALGHKGAFGDMGHTRRYRSTLGDTWHTGDTGQLDDKGNT